MAGESGPTAFLSGSNSPARSVSTIVQRSAMGSASKMNCSNFTALGSAGLIDLPAVVDVGDLLDGTMERQPLLAHQPLDERPLEDMDGDAAGPELERPFGHAPAGQLGGQVGVLDHLRTAVDGHDHAQLLVGREPLDDLERHLGVRLAVQADERRVGDPDQRIVHLKVEERPHASRRASRPGNWAIPPGPGAASAASVPPWPSGESATRSFDASRTLPVARSTAGICPWVKNRTCSRPNRPWLSKKSIVASWFSGLVMM